MPAPPPPPPRFKKTCPWIILPPHFLFFQVLFPLRGRYSKFTSSSFKKREGGRGVRIIDSLQQNIDDALFWSLASWLLACRLFLLINQSVVWKPSYWPLLTCLNLYQVFLLERLCHFLKFLNQLSPESASKLSQFVQSPFLAIAHKQKLSQLELKEGD